MARQNLVGLVVSQGKMAKTVKVRVQTKLYDKKVHKEVLRRKDYLVHDEGNICKEGDLVRIESIPKMSARKYFAIAEIKANKGQQFALYETLAKEKISLEQEQKIGEFIAQREKLSNTITQIEDLKKLDQVTNSFKSDATADREFLLSEINKIKEKYNIKSWPATEPVLELDLTKLDKEASIEERRLAAIGQILNKLMSDGYKNERESILKELGVSSKKNEIQKNILRKYILNPNNNCPVSIEGLALN